MVKIFVGNLSPKVDVIELKKLFEQYGTVSEVDIIRNYGFVHLDDESEAKAAFDALNNFTLQGRPIHLEYSTSKLRNKPGMDDVCFRCGAKDHKTHNCPVHDGGAKTGMKRAAPPRGGDEYPPAKQRAAEDYYGNRGMMMGASNGRYRNDMDAGYGGRFSPVPRGGGGGAMYADYYGRSASGGAGAVGYEDSIIPRPPDRLLAPLYEEYLTARERYYYYRDRLERELYAMRRTGTVPPVAPAPPPPASSTGRVLGAAAYGGGGGGVSAYANSMQSANALDMFGSSSSGRSRSPTSIARYQDHYGYNQPRAAVNSNAAVYEQYGQKPNVAIFEYDPQKPNIASLSSGRSLYDPYP